MTGQEIVIDQFGQLAESGVPQEVTEALRGHGVTAPIDVHLMVKPVDRIIPDFAKAGATYITFHPEASRHIDRSLGLIRDEGCKAGLVFNPATSLDWLDHVLEDLDVVHRRGSPMIEKVIRSAMANAGQDLDVDVNRLYVSDLRIDEGPTLKRYRPRAQGRAYRINKKTSHIVLVVDER